ncbi:MAG: hypothetical protein HY290_27635 [Planctomycetia bacterium]|nr:hypothetical protein [Planctomycetia bacterium]
MNNAPDDWLRPLFRQPGGRPLLFYVVYGQFETLEHLSQSKYRSQGIPSGFELMRYGAGTHDDVLARFQDGYMWQELLKENSALADRVVESKECLILCGEIDDCENLNYLRDNVGLLTFLLDQGGVTVYDPFILKWWEPKEWRARIFDPAGPVPRHHVVVLTSAEDKPGMIWFHTRGLRKFGRPELSIHHVPATHREAVIDLCERFIELQAFGGVIDEDQEIRMKCLPQGMTCHHAGDLDDPDFNNVHVEIKWP